MGLTSGYRAIVAECIGDYFQCDANVGGEIGADGCGGDDGRKGAIKWSIRFAPSKSELRLIWLGRILDIYFSSYAWHCWFML